MINSEEQSLIVEVAGNRKVGLQQTIPWERLEDAFADIKDMKEERKHKDIIVVASFIEKVPNLGGLTRTCNVFNATALVIPSIQTMEVTICITLESSIQRLVKR